jgi:metal-dependent amidase/aminoacylase/carboxypeptidase family protein
MPGYCAAAVACFLRRLADEMGGSQVATVGALTLHPNLINVIAARAEVTVDLRNTDESLLQQAEQRLAAFVRELATAEGVRIEARPLARFAPVQFDASVAGASRGQAQRLGYDTRPMTSGAGHDAQMMARLCPTAMIFVPSVKGISHNPAEHTDARTPRRRPLRPLQGQGRAALRAGAGRRPQRREGKLVWSPRSARRRPAKARPPPPSAWATRSTASARRP